MTFEKNARIVTSQEIAFYRKATAAHKAKDIYLTREQGNWLIVNVKKHLSQDFWRAWRTQKEEMKEAGYRVAKAYDHWIAY